MDIKKLLNLIGGVGNKKSIITIVLLILGAGFLFFQKTRYDSRLRSLQEQIVTADSLVQYYETVYQKKFVDGQHLDLKNQQIEKLLSEAESDIFQWHRISGRYQDAVIGGETWKGKLNEFTVDSLAGTDKGVDIDGWTGHGLFEITVYRQPLQLDIVSSQDKNGIWRTTVDTGDPYLEIESIKSRIEPFGSAFKKRFFISVGGGVVQFGDELNRKFVCGAGLGYGDYGLNLYTNGSEYGLFISKRFNF